jgi:altronate dehydratase
MEKNDNCATSLDDLSKGKQINENENKITLNQDIEIGHKFALEKIMKGEYVKKYGEIIGIATEDINRGDWIHTHNIKSKYLEDTKND